MERELPTWARVLEMLAEVKAASQDSDLVNRLENTILDYGFDRYHDGLADRNP